MKGPIRLPAPQSIVPMVNRSGNTIRKNCLVGYGTADFTGDRPIDSLDVAGVGKIAGAIQASVLDDESASVYRDGDVVLESDGSGTISVGQRVIAVAGASLAASGRVAELTEQAGGAARSVEDLAREQYDLTTQLLRLQGDTKTLRERELARPAAAGARDGEGLAHAGLAFFGRSLSGTGCARSTGLTTSGNSEPGWNSPRSKYGASSSAAPNAIENRPRQKPNAL
jgi:hypothetical protein